LIDQGTIQTGDTSGNSRGQARERAEKRSYGHQSGAGSRRGTAGARRSDKDEWMTRIRALRSRLKELRDDGPLNRSQYRELYDKASGGEFEDVRRLEAYIRSNYGIEVSD
jgi:LSU ribosomal protein L19E